MTKVIEAASPIHPNSEDINLEDDPLSVWIRGKGERVPSGEGAVWPAGQGDLPLGQQTATSFLEGSSLHLKKR